MNLGEFKAWLAGYLESCSASLAKRVKRIEEKLAEVREPSRAVPAPIYVDKYIYPRYPRPWTAPIVTWGNTFTTDTSTVDWTITGDNITCNDGTGTMTVASISTGGD